MQPLRFHDVIAGVATFLLMATPSALAANVHRVNVGSKGLTFDPSTIFAPAGDTVQFFFFPTGFSVVQGDPNAPCAPLSGGFFSGYVATASGAAESSFAVTTNNSDPIFFYSSKDNDCQSGMVGVINPTGGQALDSYRAGAAGLATATVGTGTPPPLPTATGPVGGVLIASGRAVNATGISIGNATATGGAAGVVTSFTDSAGSVVQTTLPGSDAGATTMATDTTSPEAAGGSGVGTATGSATPTGMGPGTGGEGGAAGGTAGSGQTAASSRSSGLAPAVAAGRGEVLGVAGLIMGFVAGLV